MPLPEDERSARLFQKDLRAKIARQGQTVPSADPIQIHLRQVLADLGPNDEFTEAAVDAHLPTLDDIDQKTPSHQGRKVTPGFQNATPTNSHNYPPSVGGYGRTPVPTIRHS